LHVQLQKGKQSSVKFSAASGRKITLTRAFLVIPSLFPRGRIWSFRLKEGWPVLRLVFDAKYRVDSSPEYVERYKTPGPPEDALNIMYRYRDAIVDSVKVSGSEVRPKRTVIQAAAAFP